jgi:ABC-type transporter Mla subunit MlaD
MERAVGWFVLLATLLLAAGFAYYIYNTAERKGWFIEKVQYQTSLANASGLKVGDPVMLMGFTVGDITHIEANGPWDYYGVTVFFKVKKPYYGYIWSDSVVKVAGAGFLGSRTLEVTKGVQGVPTVKEDTNKVATGLLNGAHLKAELKALIAKGRSANEAMADLNQAARSDFAAFYGPTDPAKPYWLDPAESPAVTERLERMADQIEKALPGVLRLTNQLAQILENGAQATSNLNLVASNARPASENLARLSAQLAHPGGLGDWLLPQGGSVQVAAALTNANTLLVNTDTNLAAMTSELSRSLDSLASMTSNLNAQVQANTNVVKAVSDAIIHTDELVQGLKHHWLLRSAFKTPSTNKPPAATSNELHAPNDPFR